MKKLTTTLSLILATATCITIASCGAQNKKEDKNLKVYSEYTLTEESYAFAIAKNNNELKTNVDNYLKENKPEIDNLINSYFDGTAKFTYENKTSTPGDSDFILVTNATFPPFESLEGNKFKGIDIEIGYKLAESFGKTLFVKDIKFDSIIPEVQKNKNSIGMAGMTVNDKRKQQVDFAGEGYYKSAQAITVKEGDEKFKDCKSAEDIIKVLKAQDENFKIGTQNGTTGYMYTAGDEGFGYEGFKNLTTKGYDSGALALLDLKNGKIDAVILDLQPSLMITKTLNK